MRRSAKRLFGFAPAALVLLASPTPPSAKTVGPLLRAEPVLLSPVPPLGFSIPPAPPAPVQPQPVPTQVEAPTASPPPDAPTAIEGVRVVVSIPQQKAYVFLDGDLFGTSPVSTGKRGHETPVGRFRILQKDIDHRSNKYSNAPMPFMQRLTSYGIALHAGHLPGYPASHGCIRLPWGFARKLYKITDFQTQVTITRQRPRNPEEALSLA